jgi:hypothetical protein
MLAGTVLTASLGALAACTPGADRGSGATAGTGAPPTTGVSRLTGATFTMPGEVGKVLQAAQDDIQRVSRDPFFYSSSRDATGRGRHQILDRDWKVCSQNVPAGQVVRRSTVLVTFNVVKLTETCPEVQRSSGATSAAATGRTSRRG